MQLKSFTSSRGFTLVDLSVVLVVLVSLTAVAAPSLNGAWKNRLARGSANNLHTLGVASAMYSGANDDKIPTYSWRGPIGDETHIDYTLPDGTLTRAHSDQDAASIQNTAILMERTGRLDGDFEIRRYSARLPHRRFTHLVLWDFMGPKFSSEVFVDPADENMLHWHRNPLDYLLGSTVPYFEGAGGDYAGFEAPGYWAGSNMRQRWAFSPSYFTVPAAWMGQGADAQYRPVLDNMNLFQGTGSEAPLHIGNQLSIVAFPSSKVYMHEEYDRRQGPAPTHYAYDFARPMKLMFDGSLNIQTSGEGSSSYNSSTDELWRQRYLPLHTYPFPIGGAGDNTTLDLRYRWTRHGLLGVDYTP